MFDKSAVNFLGGGSAADSGGTDWLSHTIKATLHTSTWVPNTATNETKADATNELTTANGYTAGGQTLTCSIPDETEPINFVVADFSWTASGGSIGPFRYCVIWNDTPTTPADPLIGYIDVGSDTTITNGNTITFDCDQTNGLFTGQATQMALYSASAQGAAGTATLPFFGLRSGASTNNPIVREIKCFTTAANAARIRIVRLTTAGTATAITENEMNEAMTAPIATAVHTYSSTAPTIQAGDVDIAAVGAAVGSGFHYTYYGEGKGLYIPGAATDANGIALIEVADTANTYDVTVIWEE